MDVRANGLTVGRRAVPFQIDCHLRFAKTLSAKQALQVCEVIEMLQLPVVVIHIFERGEKRQNACRDPVTK